MIEDPDEVVRKWEVSYRRKVRIMSLLLTAAVGFGAIALIRWTWNTYFGPPISWGGATAAYLTLYICYVAIKFMRP